MARNLLTITYPYFSLFRVGVSLFHIHSKITAGRIKRLVTHTPKKISAIIVHYMCVKTINKSCQFQSQYVTKIKTVDVGEYLDTLHHLFCYRHQTIQSVVQQYQIHYLYLKLLSFLNQELTAVYLHHKISIVVSLYLTLTTMLSIVVEIFRLFLLLQFFLS